jgi:predicted DsbA family dithiol-disulfide isomerase
MGHAVREHFEPIFNAGSRRMRLFQQPVKVTVFSDYICPYCYLGWLRLEKLRSAYDLRVNWCMLKIADRAWQAARYTQRLRDYALAARELGVDATPTVYFNRQPLRGLQTTETLFAAAHQALTQTSVE